MKEADFLGKSVVSMADGARVGKVKDLVFLDLSLISLVVKGERGEGLLPFGSLDKNGPDAITISSYSVVDWNPGSTLVPNHRKVQDLRKLSVVDSEGNMLGKIHDFTMDSIGHVAEIDIRTEGVFGIGAVTTMVTGSQVCAIGEDLMTVKTAPGQPSLSHS